MAYSKTTTKTTVIKATRGKTLHERKEILSIYHSIHHTPQLVLIVLQ